MGPPLMVSFQVRLGNMDGIFVAYHNTRTMFGFQYISKEEMDARVYGNVKFADMSFAICWQALEAILDSIVTKYPDKVFPTPTLY